jgi:hypothetical protein
VAGVLRRRIVIDPQGTPGLSSIGAVAEHHVGQVAGIVADRAKGINISPRWPADRSTAIQAWPSNPPGLMLGSPNINSRPDPRWWSVNRESLIDSARWSSG